jgi:hypothetical protein
VEKGGGGQEARREKDASDIMYNNIGVMRNLEPFCGGLQEEEEEEEEETGVITYALRSGRSCKRQVCCTSELIIEVFCFFPPLPLGYCRAWADGSLSGGVSYRRSICVCMSLAIFLAALCSQGFGLVIGSLSDFLSEKIFLVVGRGIRVHVDTVFHFLPLRELLRFFFARHQDCKALSMCCFTN